MRVSTVHHYSNISSALGWKKHMQLTERNLLIMGLILTAPGSKAKPPMSLREE